LHYGWVFLRTLLLTLRRFLPGDFGRLIPEERVDIRPLLWISTITLSPHRRETNPSQIVAAGGEIVVLDSGNYRIQILDLRGHFLKQFRLPDVSNGTGLAMDGNGNIYVTDPQLNQLQVFSHSGEFLYKFGESGTGPGQFNGVSGMWVDSGHCLYVVDSKNKRVQLFQIAAANADGC
jgi:DNA-binding beta-propeller fold protein YncE